MDNKFNEVRRLVEEDDELKTSDRYTKVRAKNHLFEWSGQQLDILLRRVAGAKKVLTNLLSKKADLVDGKVPKSQLPSDIGVDAVLFSPQALTPQQQEQARVNIGAFAKNQFAGPQYYAVDTSLFPQISSFNPEDTIYDDEADTIYSILNHPINLLVAVQNLKVVKAHTYSMIYENNDSSLVLIGNYIYMLL